MTKRSTVAGILVLFALAPAAAQIQFDKLQRDRARRMLHDLQEGLKKNYYDPTYHGVDMDSRFKAADENLQKATNLGQALILIGASLDALNDSHTFFNPPSRATRREFGYAAQMIGDRCFITAVRPDTDASEKLAPGDQVMDWEGYTPTRQTLWKMNYAFNKLYGLQVHHLTLRSPDGKERKVIVTPKVTQGKRVLDLTGDNDIWQLIREDQNDERLNRQRYVEFGDMLMIWKMPEFDMTDDEVDRMLKQARKFQALVLDLRGNPGGLVKTLERVVGDVMDHDVTIAKRTGRKSDLKPQLAKSRSFAFEGKLTVLVDSRSASAAELMARVVQLEHRGTVLGDLSSGSVMESRYYSFKQGADTEIFYGASITDADLVMSDGKSLEHTGVTPDELILPTAADLSAGRDPVLARAAHLAGVEIDADKAGKLFPPEWRKD
ncbi:MAG TPA: S41 family peptidase [Bryobacteraceae bacterium]|nr:S41 family peptidase [Bryobacteraceae bacterium]